jgi:hypothetical protein
MKALLSQEAPKDVVERLESILLEIERLPLPVGKIGAAFLDMLEVMGRVRKRVRNEAKALLRKAPGALPGWRVSRNGAPERGQREPTVVIRSHHRRSAVRLIQGPRILQ